MSFIAHLASHLYDEHAVRLHACFVSSVERFLFVFIHSSLSFTELEVHYALSAREEEYEKRIKQRVKIK
jgi:hypothetical protein